MYWKYTLETGDKVTFTYNQKRATGSLVGIVFPNGEPVDPTQDKYDPSDFEVLIESGKHVVEVNMTDVKKRNERVDERETDIPSLTENFRPVFSDGRSLGELFDSDEIDTVDPSNYTRG